MPDLQTLLTWNPAVLRQDFRILTCRSIGGWLRETRVWSTWSMKKCWETWACLVWSTPVRKYEDKNYEGDRVKLFSAMVYVIQIQGATATCCGFQGSSSILRKAFSLVSAATLKHVIQGSHGSLLQAQLTWSSVGDSLTSSGMRGELTTEVASNYTRIVPCFHLHLWTWPVKATPKVHISSHEQNVGTPVLRSKFLKKMGRSCTLLFPSAIVFSKFFPYPGWNTQSWQDV